MEDIIAYLDAGEIQKAQSLLKAFLLDTKKTESLRKEFKDIDRSVRETQAGNIQKVKVIKNQDGSTKARVPAQVISVPFQNKIVRTATAFEYGRPCTITPNDENELSEALDRVWRNERIDGHIKKMIRLRKSELQCALLFYIKEIEKGKGIINKILGTGSTYQVKTKILENKDGIMYPYFDSQGDMVFFTWEFETENAGKKANNIWVYTKEFVYQSSNAGGTYVTEKNPHGFSKIPVVYTAQESAEWFEVQRMIDRFEVGLSKLANSNDYSAHPILKTTGKVTGLPDKDDDGKTINLEIKETEKGIMESKADYLTHDNAPESMKLEKETLKELIYSLTSTPDLSFDNVKGIGNISGVALELMFLDPLIKASDNEEVNREMISRIINVIISGIIVTVEKNLSSLSETTFFDIQFNSVMPNDLKNLVSIVTQAVNAGVMSKKTGIEKLGLVDDVNAELADIAFESGNTTTEE